MGELLIDMVPDSPGVPLESVEAIRPAVGGAPANVAAGQALLGNPSRFVGKVVDDAFGRKAVRVLAGTGVQVDRIQVTSKSRTCLAFVSLTHAGERDFLFYREPGADTLLTREELDQEGLRNAPIFHHGSISLISEPSRTATLAALEWAWEGGALISYDPNLREHLWPGPQAAHRWLREPLGRAHLLKVSAEELAFLMASGETFEPARRPLEPMEAAEAAERLAEQYPNLLAVVVTFGARGAAVRTRWGWSFVPPFQVQAVDTTGAGDAFVAGLLHWIWRAARRQGLTPRAMAAAFDRNQWYGAVRFAQGVGALAVTRYGAIPSLPTLREVASFLAQEGEMELL